MKNYEKFLETYKKIEQILYKDNIKVQDYEEQLNNSNRKSDADKLRLCRTLRNYLSHQDGATNFISISTGMQTFLESILFSLDAKSIPVKKKMIPLSKCLCESSTVEDAVKYLYNHKTNLVPFFNKSNIPVGIFNTQLLLKLINDGKSLITTKLSAIKLLCPINFTGGKKDNMSLILDTAPLSTLEAIPEDNAIIVVNSKKEYVGFIPF